MPFGDPYCHIGLLSSWPVTSNYSFGLGCSFIQQALSHHSHVNISISPTVPDLANGISAFNPPVQLFVKIMQNVFPTKINIRSLMKCMSIVLS